MFPGAAVDAATRKAIASLRDSRANWSSDELGILIEVAKARRRKGRFAWSTRWRLTAQ
jgi:hypothetical protein